MAFELPARILIVDDHPLGVKLLRYVLDEDSYDVESAGALSAAEQSIAQSPPDLVVLDLWLPDGDGLELARKIKRDPATGHCMIIACTAGAMEGDRERALAAGCDDYISKPLQTRVFLEKVRALLRRKLLSTGAAAQAPLTL